LLAALGSAAPRTTQARRSTDPEPAYLWEFFFPSLFLFASLFPSSAASPGRSARVGARASAAVRGAGVLPHLVHFGVLLGIALWKPSLGSNGGVLGLFGTVAKVGGLFVELFHRPPGDVLAGQPRLRVGAVLLLGESYGARACARFASRWARSAWASPCALSSTPEHAAAGPVRHAGREHPAFESGRGGARGRTASIAYSMVR
jgi:hypothetical protein